MYRHCAECGRPRWWPGAEGPGPCGHSLGDPEHVDLAEGVGRCEPARLLVVVRQHGQLGSVAVRPGATAALARGIGVEAAVSSSGAIAVRFVPNAEQDPVGRPPASKWTAIAGERRIAVEVQGVASGLVVEVDLAVAPVDAGASAGCMCLRGLDVGSVVAVAAGEDGTLRIVDSGGHLLLAPREDNCLRAVCTDATGFTLNGEPIAVEVVRPGDILGTASHRWRWRGIERGFEPAPPAGAFEVSASGLSLAGRVKDFTVSFRSGELAAVVGGSGSGKTTLVRMVAGILIPTGGSMVIRSGGNVREYGAHELERFAADVSPHVSYIPQEDAVLPELTVRQAVEYAYLLHPSNRGKARSRQALSEQVSFVLQSVGLEEHAEKLVERLSGGQRRRVNLALGLVGAPDLVILDEPTTGLDFSNERRTMQLLRRIARQGCAVVVVTHSMDALRFADRCVVVTPGPDGAGVAATFEGHGRIAASEARIAALISGASGSRGGEAPGGPARVRHPRPRFAELVARSFRQWINTPRAALVAFVLLPLVLGIMVRLGSGSFRKDRIAIGLVAIFWLGVNQSVRDLLKDLDVIRREDLDGTSPTRQILARACFAFAVSAIGAVMMTAPFHWLELRGWLLVPDTLGQYTDRVGAGGDQTLLPWWLTIACFWAAGAMGGFFGLAIASACSFARRKAESIAVLASVLVTLPQFLYSEKCLSEGLVRSHEHYGYFFRTWHGESEQFADWLSFLTVTRWTYLPAKAWMDQVQGTRIYELSAVMLGAGAVASLVLAAGLLTVSINVERGAGWLPRRRAVKKARSAP